MADPIRSQIRVLKEKAILVNVILPDHNYEGIRDPLDELNSLAETAGAIVMDRLIQKRFKANSATLLGKGKVQELATLVKEYEAEVAIFNNGLSPAQIRNIEEVTHCKIIDRSELILDIFANRAKTYEAKLQVELAQLEYTYPRLRAMWSHLERIAGGSPAGIGTRGPGEQQLEIDRRIVQTRKSELKREIAKIQDRKRREVDKRNADHFTVGLVGYTNAGKSTLFNTLTAADVYADDKLFATLDTRTRRWDLGGGDQVMLSDTVGFIRDLPHHLVASFKATLDEALHADLLLLVMDVSDSQAARHMETVTSVLEDIGAGDTPRLILLNKTDQLEDNAELLIWRQEFPDSISISARMGTGLDAVVEAVREAQRGKLKRLKLRLPMAEGKAIQFIENRTQIHDRDYDATDVTFDLTIGERQFNQIKGMGARFEVVS